MSITVSFVKSGMNSLVGSRVFLWPNGAEVSLVLPGTKPIGSVLAVTSATGFFLILMATTTTNTTRMSNDALQTRIARLQPVSEVVVVELVVVTGGRAVVVVELVVVTGGRAVVVVELGFVTIPASVSVMELFIAAGGATVVEVDALKSASYFCCKRSSIGKVI